MNFYDRRIARFQNTAMFWGGGEAPRGRYEVDSAPNRKLVGDAMAQLPDEYRAVIRRSYYQGWTTAHIAADLEITESAVKLRLHYALRALREMLQEIK